MMRTTVNIDRAVCVKVLHEARMQLSWPYAVSRFWPTQVFDEWLRFCLI